MDQSGVKFLIRAATEKKEKLITLQRLAEGAFEETSGDAFDAILKYLARKDPTGTAEDPDLGPLLTKINTIKARYPKP
ncbi:hypothetical protein [Sneathiella glossodoripedis]|uniref:hypothetical protein n=1 Tax=Sneathiella glossodoripedis TaxID=418853 RepID=UPI0011DD21EC|nr:hypothetical protein [Sneathiella glossodoripedis]